jgi:hypothetical protein
MPMTISPNDRPRELRPGVRVQVCNSTLQAFYGHYGTVTYIRTCPRDGHITHVDVQMDDLPVDEPQAVFYPNEISMLTSPNGNQ